MLLGAKGLHGFDLCGAAAGDEGGSDGGEGEDADYGKDDGEVGGFGVVEEGCETAADGEAGEGAEDEARRYRHDDGCEHEAVDAFAGGAEGHADTDLLCAGFDGVAECAVDAEEREEECGGAEGYEDGGFEVLGCEGVGRVVSRECGCGRW